MEGPNVRNVLTDERRGVRYEVLAYRALTEDELIMSVRFALSQMRRKPKRGQTVTVVSVIGARD